MATIHVHAANIQSHRGNRLPYIVTIKWENKQLSITGVEGPYSNGDAAGGCGQTMSNDTHVDRAPFYDKLMEIWDRWHLNKMRAGSPAQEVYLREHPIEFKYPQSHYVMASEALSAAGLNPDNGYLYGSAWLSEEVPQDVIDWLFALPQTDKMPARWAA